MQLKTTKRKRESAISARDLDRMKRAYHDANCVDTVCGSYSMRHGHCASCGAYTRSHGVYIDPKTLRRRVPFLCDDCQRSSRFKSDQERLTESRVSRDWTLVSDPIEEDAIIGARMPEQYSSKARAAIRAFFDAGFEVATIPESDVATINNSIRSLGLQNHVYAERRDSETILRRIS